MSHLHVEDRPQVMEIRRNLQLNIPQSGATPHAKLGRVMRHQANCLPPILVPSLLSLQYSSCLQEAAESGTPHHIAPRQSSLLFYVFSGPPQQQQSRLKGTKTTDKKNSKQKNSSIQLKIRRVKSQGLQTDSANSSQGYQGSTGGLVTKIAAILTSKPVSNGRAQRCCCYCLDMIIVSESLRRNQGKVSQGATR